MREREREREIQRKKERERERDREKERERERDTERKRERERPIITQYFSKWEKEGIQIMHTQICKSILKVNRATPNN